MTYILGIDPGGKPPNGTTGISLFELTGAGLIRLRTWAITGGYPGFCRWLRTDPDAQHLQDIEPHVVCEKYVVYNAAGDPAPLLIEGLVGYIWPNTIFQPASGKNTAVPNEILEAQGWWDDSSHHADVRESGRHVVYWLKKQGNPTVLRMFE